MSKLPKRGTLVVATWLDATGSDRWGDRDIGVANCTSVGWLTASDKDHVVLSASHAPTLTPWGARTAIPRRAVTEVRRLKVGKRR